MDRVSDIWAANMKQDQASIENHELRIHSRAHALSPTEVTTISPIVVYRVVTDRPSGLKGETHEYYTAHEALAKLREIEAAQGGATELRSTGFKRAENEKTD